MRHICIVICLWIGAVYGIDQSEPMGHPSTQVDTSLAEFLGIDQPSWSILCSIGDCYMQADDYGRAIVYYARACKQKPRDMSLSSKLVVSRRAAGDPQQIQRPFDSIRYFSTFERYVFTIAIIWMTCIAFSLYVWCGISRWLYLSLMVMALAMLSVECWIEWGEPQTAIVLQPIAAETMAFRLGDEVLVVDQSNDLYVIIAASGERYSVPRLSVMII